VLERALVSPHFSDEKTKRRVKEAEIVPKVRVLRNGKNKADSE